MRIKFSFLVYALLLGMFATESARAQQDLNVTVRDQPVDDASIKAEIFKRGMQVIKEGYVSGETLLKQLAACPASLDLKVPVTGKREGESVFDSCLASTLVIGNLFDCGKCDKTHLSIGGAVVLSADGLILTNYHVVANKQTINLIAMGHDGKMYPVVEVLAVNKSADLAVARIDADGLTPVRLAAKNAQALDELFVISHPHSRFFLTTTGVVSRYAYGKNESGARTNWLEISAVFSQGSSGCGVFDRQGQLIGLVSRKEVVYAKSASGQKQQVLTIRKCVPISAVHEMINGGSDDDGDVLESPVQN